LERGAAAVIEPNVEPRLSPAAARHIDQTCDRFEAAWKAGPRPDPADFLDAAGEPERSALLRQLLLLDWDYRRRAGDDPSPTEYHARFPADPTVIEAVERDMSEALVSTRTGAERVALDTSWVGDPFDRSADAGPGPDADPDRYDLDEEVGHGGIGIVYRGQDRRLGRHLAVKVLREEYRDRPDARRRFVAEARVGSQLQHPAIVPVYELGRFDDGRPYITMKLVEGRTLAALLRDRAPPTDLPRLLTVFEQVCQAVAYAHSKGVIHRDLKPANVMVGAFGEVQVMDWGFAKILADDANGATHSEPTAKVADFATAGQNGATHSGALMGTPAYMPPEQARGDAARVDRRADVFALGAILCEILTGRPPYAAVAADDVYHMAAAGDLGDAHARLAGCGADAGLCELAGNCLAADPAARPADAGAVAREVTAYLASAQERLRRAQVERAAAEARTAAERRNRRVAATLATVALAGAGVAGWQALVATRAKGAALAAATAESAAKGTAETKEAETRSVLEFVQKHIIAAARPQGQSGGLRYDVTLREALKASLPKVELTFANQPLVEARVRRTLGESFLLLGDAGVAADQFQKARTIQTDRLGPTDDETLLTTNDLAAADRDLGKLPEATALFEETLTARTAKYGRHHRDTLDSMQNLATLYADRDRIEDALRLREEAVETRKILDGPTHPETLHAMSQLANSYSDAGRPKAALKIDREVLALLEAKYGVGHVETLGTRNNLAIDYAADHQYEAALKLQKETLAMYRAKFPPDHPMVLAVMHNVAKAYADIKDYESAIKLLEEALAIQKVKLPPNHPNTIQTVYSLANHHGKLNHHDEALRLHREALEARKATLDPNHRDTLYSMWGVAAQLVALGQNDEALPIIDDCLRRAAGNAAAAKFSLLADKRLRIFEKARDAAGCRGTAELWESLKCTDADSLYQAACFRAVTAAVARSAGDQAEAAAEADRAMAWLKKALAAGYNGKPAPDADPDLTILHSRPDFKALLADSKPGR
jgi:tetratricopeptide (TPR) repeat protein